MTAGCYYETLLRYSTVPQVKTSKISFRQRRVPRTVSARQSVPVASASGQECCPADTRTSRLLLDNLYPYKRLRHPARQSFDMLITRVLCTAAIARPIRLSRCACQRAVDVACLMPSVGQVLPLPTDFSDLHAIPSSVKSLSDISGGRDILVLAASTESAMTDPLRQTLVGLQEMMVPLDGTQAAAVTLVGLSSYRKLARKASVDFPLLSDPGLAWLGPLGSASGGSISAYVLAVPSAVVLASFEEMKPQAMLEAVGAALAKGRSTLEREASASLAADRAAAAAAEEAAEAARQQEAEASKAGKRLAEARAAAKAEERRRVEAELAEANARQAALLAAEADAKDAKAREKQARQQQQQQGSDSKAAAKLRAAQEAQEAQMMERMEQKRMQQRQQRRHLPKQSPKPPPAKPPPAAKPPPPPPKAAQPVAATAVGATRTAKTKAGGARAGSAEREASVAVSSAISSAASPLLPMVIQTLGAGPARYEEAQNHHRLRRESA